MTRSVLAMPRHFKRPSGLGLAILGIVLLVGLAGLVGGLARGLRDPNGEASAAYARGDWEQAAHLAYRRLKQVPGDPGALLLTARASARQDRDQGAVAIYSRVPEARMQPEDYYLLGRALSRGGQLEPALKALETAKERNQAHPETLDLLCRIYYQTDRPFAAEDAAIRLARFPGHQAQGHLMLGLARAELDDPAGEAEGLRRWLELDPQGRLALPDPVRPLQRQLAAALLRSSRPAEARRLLEKLLKSGPDPAAAWLLGRAYLQQQEWSRFETTRELASPFLLEHSSPAEPAPRIGEARCGACHRAEHSAVLASRHAATVFRPGDLRDLRLPETPLLDPGDPRVTHAFHRDGEALRVETHSGTRVFGAVIDYAFGSRDHLSTFVGRGDHKRSVMLRISVHIKDGEPTWSLSSGLPARPSRDEEYLGNALLDRDGVRRCLTCHTTSFRAVMDRAGPEAADHSIGCEKCHGPGGHHELAVLAGVPETAIAATRRSTPTEIHSICAECHGLPRTEILSLPRTSPALYRFQSLTLTWSRCFIESEGAMSCVTCHDPHRNVETSIAINEARCLSCHLAARGPIDLGYEAVGGAITEPAADLTGGRKPDSRKSAPCPVSPSRGCLECHMPRAWDPETFAFKTDHWIRVRSRDGAP